MRSRIVLPLVLFAAAFLFGSCGSGGGAGNADAVGPFDEDGNYIEAWADNPPKKGSSRRKNARPEPEPEPEVKPRIVRQEPKPEPRIAARPRTTPKTVSRPVVSKPKPKPKPKVASKPKPKPKPVKVTPKVTRHTVKKGDTLYNLSRRYGSSVSQIQKANRISGTRIRLGQSLVIPK